MKPVNAILSGYGTTIFTVMSALAQEHGAINLGQGFPDVDGPEDIRRVAAEAVIDGPNQYPPMLGLPELRQAVAQHNRRFYGLEVDWRTEVMVEGVRVVSEDEMTADGGIHAVKTIFDPTGNPMMTMDENVTPIDCADFETRRVQALGATTE